MSARAPIYQSRSRLSYHQWLVIIVRHSGQGSCFHGHVGILGEVGARVVFSRSNLNASDESKVTPGVPDEGHKSKGGDKYIPKFGLLLSGSGVPQAVTVEGGMEIQGSPYSTHWIRDVRVVGRRKGGKTGVALTPKP
jgi:hypothetical protein